MKFRGTCRILIALYSRIQWGWIESRACQPSSTRAHLLGGCVYFNCIPSSFRSFPSSWYYSGWKAFYQSLWLLLLLLYNISCVVYGTAIIQLHFQTALLANRPPTTKAIWRELFSVGKTLSIFKSYRRSRGRIGLVTGETQKKRTPCRKILFM